MVDRRWFSLVAVSLSISGGAAFVACGGNEFTAAAYDAGADSAPMVDATPPSDGGSLDARPSRDAGVQAVIVYVAPGGSDESDGLSPATAKRTIAAGLATGAALGAGAEVHVCAGTYDESTLVLGSNVSLRGAYSCGTWLRSATFGFPTFDHANTTRVTNANPALQPQTLVISGSVASSVVVDGLAVQGAATLAGQTAGVLVKDEASPVLSDDEIAGGAGKVTTGFGSEGLSIQGSASPQVVHDVINGGTGTGTTGSVGVYVNSTGAPSVQSDVISGGLGTSVAPTGPTATWGIFIATSAVLPNGLTNDVVLACDSPGATATTGGIQIAGGDASVDITESQIVGCPGDAGASYGIHVSSPGSTVHLDQDRVYGGSRSQPGGFAGAVSVAAVGSLSIHNSMLHAGEVTGTGGSTTTLDVGPTAGVDLDYDTVYAGASGTAIVLPAGSSGARIIDVLLAGAGPAPTTHAAVFSSSCAAPPAVLESSLFADFAGSLYSCSPGDGGATNAATTLAAVSQLVPGASADRLLGACADDAGPGCVPSTACPGDASTCLGSLFGGAWTPDDGVSGLFASTLADGGTVIGGWALAAGAPCAVGQGGVPISGITTDLYGHPRSTTTPSIGASEIQSSCAP